MQLGHVELFVDDPELSRDFYVNVLGFDLVQEQGSNIWVKLGEKEILLRPGKGSKSSIYQDTAAGLVIYTENLEKSRSELEDRGLEFKGIDGSEKCLTFQDLDGHWFQLVNPHDH